MLQGSPTTELEAKHLADMDLRGAAPAEMSAGMAANATRGLIKSVFKCRSCCALTTPHAGNGRAIQNAGDNELSQEFLQVGCLIDFNSTQGNAMPAALDLPCACCITLCCCCLTVSYQCYATAASQHVVG